MRSRRPFEVKRCTENNIHIYCIVPGDYVSEPVDRVPRTDAKTAIGRRVRFCIHAPPPLADGRTGSRNRARRGGLTTIHNRDGCPETVQSLYYSLRIAPSFRSMSTCVPIQCTRSAKTCTRDSA